MDDTLMELLNSVTLMDLVWALVLIATVVVIVVTQKKRISKWLNKWRKDKNDEDDFKELVASLKESVDSLKADMKTYQENREHDRADSKKIQKEIYEAIDKQKASIADLKQVTLDIQQKNAKTKRAELKEKIERLYRECSPTKTCTHMAYETLKELIEEYEENGGINSFVHSKVEPEMVTWTRVEAIPHE